MRWLALLLALTACKTGSAQGNGDQVTYHPAGTLADDDFKPTYDKSDLHNALITERTAASSAEQRVHDLEDKGDYDQVQTANADLAVRQRFIASLEACETLGQTCPPRLDEPAWTYDVEADVDPKLDAPLRFDVTSWQKVSAELAGRACACRTIACVDSMFAAIDRLEKRPMPEVQSDEAASSSVTQARECLYRLRGLRRTPRAVAGD
ncbi:MAG TPA: hypothetical protein VFV99_17400 [Kofleriaceae bacterium]|nr:hypothetical protein [Kofleriaceae bacterium]